jgi:transmembrane sensor
LNDKAYEPDEVLGPREVNACAARWLVKQHTSPTWTSNDQAALDSWMAVSPTHMMAYWRLEAVWSRADRLAALREQPAEGRTGGYARIVSTVWRGIAGILLFGIFVTGANFYLNMGKSVTYETALGGHKVIDLADGSKIELNTNTSIRFAAGQSQREVWLDKGEAYFQIKHDAARPFIVVAGGQRVVDVGTSFLMRRDAKRLQVMLTEGRARLEPTEPDSHLKAVVLAPGDVVVATANGIIFTKKQSSQIADLLAWRSGLLAFDNTPLAEVATEFNRYNRQKLIVVGDNIRGIGVGGHFRANNVEAFKRIARNILGLHVESHDDETVISR